MKRSEQENGETTGKHSPIPKEEKGKRGKKGKKGKKGRETKQRSNEIIPQGQPMRCEE